MGFKDFRKCARCKMDVNIVKPGHHKQEPPPGRSRSKYYHNECWAEHSAEQTLGFIPKPKKELVPKEAVEPKKRPAKPRQTKEKDLVLDFMREDLGMTTKDAESRIQDYYSDGISVQSMLDALRYCYIVQGNEKKPYGHWVIGRLHVQAKKHFDRVRLTNEINSRGVIEPEPICVSISPRISKPKTKKEYELE